MREIIEALLEENVKKPVKLENSEESLKSNSEIYKLEIEGQQTDLYIQQGRLNDEEDIYYLGLNTDEIEYGLREDLGSCLEHVYQRNNGFFSGMVRADSIEG